MINICQKFFDHHGIKISTDPDIKKTKTKVLVYGVESVLTPLVLGTKPLPYVTTWQHLGQTLCSDGSYTHDMMEKRRQLIGKFYSLQQDLGKQHPAVMLQLIRTYLLHLYGCPLWDIYDEGMTKMWTSWHSIVKTVYNLPVPTHRYLLTDLVKYDHVKKIIIRRFAKFHSIIEASDDPQIKLLHRCQSSDWRSVYGRNVMNICRDAHVTNMKDVDMATIKVNPVPPGEEWRAERLMDLINERDTNEHYDRDQLEILMKIVCCN